LPISRTSTNRGEQAVKGWPSNVATEFDGLSVLRLIGAGSIAMAFLARDTKPERLVALKVLKADFAADAEVLARFKNEALAAAHIVHPNVAAIYRVGERKDGLPYIAQEYIGGRSLADVLRSSEVRTVDDSTRTITSLAKALAAAAAKGIVHGNVKPDNVLIEQDSGRVVLTNFGIVGQQEAKDAVGKLTRGREGFSDARYASPEQLRGETASGSSDIFSLGVLAYELLTGRIPYEGSAPLDIRSVRADVPEELAQLLRRCVDNNPDVRPAAEELMRHLANDGRSEAPPKVLPKVPKASTRLTQRAVESSLMRVAVVAGLVIMATGAAVGFWLYMHYSQ